MDSNSKSSNFKDSPIHPRDVGRAWELLAFSREPEDAEYSVEKWMEWKTIFLSGLDWLGESGFDLEKALQRGFLNDENPRAEAEEPISFTRRSPLFRMLLELERSGHVVGDSVSQRFRITSTRQELVRESLAVVLDE